MKVKNCNVDRSTSFHASARLNYFGPCFYFCFVTGTRATSKLGSAVLMPQVWRSREWNMCEDGVYIKPKSSHTCMHEETEKQPVSPFPFFAMFRYACFSPPRKSENKCKNVHKQECNLSVKTEEENRKEKPICFNPPSRLCFCLSKYFVFFRVPLVESLSFLSPYIAPLPLVLFICFVPWTSTRCKMRENKTRNETGGGNKYNEDDF